MGCLNFIHSKAKQYYISFTMGQGDFVIYRRKVHHNFRVPIDFKDHKDSKTLSFKKSQMYCVSSRCGISFFDS